MHFGGGPRPRTERTWKYYVWFGTFALLDERSSFDAYVATKQNYQQPYPPKGKAIGVGKNILFRSKLKPIKRPRSKPEIDHHQNKIENSEMKYIDIAIQEIEKLYL
ncbi:hypothetical protein COLO4_31881 [Corchorus olitorius]|uniref:Uncharacterized protein n=1 Tax=Corchorus olitorius TaxID=93759 RepID=A0A1R3H3C0_9ROSI|nr:hypothetical protein COLO4_31881 [Corchorus olitorius]